VCHVNIFTDHRMYGKR